jgi:hypothetical protein
MREHVIRQTVHVQLQTRQTVLLVMMQILAQHLKPATLAFVVREIIFVVMAQGKTNVVFALRTVV